MSFNRIFLYPNFVYACVFSTGTHMPSDSIRVKSSKQRLVFCQRSKLEHNRFGIYANTPI